MAAADSHDTEGLKAALVASEARAAAAEAKASDAEAQVAALTLMIEKLRRALYGRRSERKERLLDELWPRVGDGLREGGGVLWGVTKPPGLQARSDTP